MLLIWTGLVSLLNIKMIGWYFSAGKRCEKSIKTWKLNWLFSRFWRFLNEVFELTIQVRYSRVWQVINLDWISISSQYEVVWIIFRLLKLIRKVEKEPDNWSFDYDICATFWINPRRHWFISTSNTLKNKYFEYIKSQ